MKINNNNKIGVQDRTSRSIEGKKDLDESNQLNQSKMFKESSQVSLSEKAKEYSKIKQIADRAPDVREDKVAYYKDLIAKGNYKVDSGELADSIIKETLKNELS